MNVSLMTITLDVVGLDCPDCAASLEKAIQALPEVETAELEYSLSRLRMTSPQREEAVRSAQDLASKMGYQLIEHHPAQSIILDVVGLDCPDCAASLEKAVQQLAGVDEAELDFGAATLRIKAQDLESSVASARRLASQMGHEIVEPEQPGVDRTEPGLLQWIKAHRRDAATALGGLLMVAALVARWTGMSAGVTKGLLIASMASSGLFVLRAGWYGLAKARTIDMNLLMSIAAVGAVFVGEHLEGAVTLLLFSVGEWLESYSTDRARHAIRSLMALAPNEATRLDGNQQVTVPVSALAVDDMILVRPGERVPMDGEIVEGASTLDQSPITGESMPVSRSSGENVFAGSINGSGPLTVRVTHLAENNTIARILSMVQEAQASRAPAQRFVDRFARIYTPIVIGLAALVALVPPLLGFGTLDAWLYRALVLLVISCPCALVIATPVTLVSTLASAARQGVLIKGGRHIEALAKVRNVALDKTGTLTRGKPQVVHASCQNHVAGENVCAVCQDLLAKAAAVEQRSEHALGHAVVSYAQHQGVLGRYASAEGVSTTPGMGISGQVSGHTMTVGNHAFSHLHGAQPDSFCAMVTQAEATGQTVLVLQDTCCAQRGYLAVDDTLRDNAADTIKRLHGAGIERVAMLTGDHRAVAERVAEEAGIDIVKADLLPGDKLNAIQELEAAYGPTAMVGDGVNDAPALARATVGIAMGVAGTDTAIETADVALMGDDLSRLPFAIRLARRSMATLRWNIMVALVIKAVFLTLAVLGYATLWMAVIADVGSSLLVTLNGMRLLGVRDSSVRRFVPSP